MVHSGPQSWGGSLIEFKGFQEKGWSVVSQLWLYNTIKSCKHYILLKQILSYFESICPVSQYAVNDWNSNSSRHSEGNCVLALRGHPTNPFIFWKHLPKFQKGLVSVLLIRKIVKEMRLYDLLGVQPGVLLKQILSYFESICPVSQYAVNDWNSNSSRHSEGNCVLALRGHPTNPFIFWKHLPKLNVLLTRSVRFITYLSVRFVTCIYLSKLLAYSVRIGTSVG